MSFNYTKEDFSVTLPVAEYIAKYRDAEKFIRFCRECPNYSHSWACPPFDFDWLPILQQYEFASLFATKIVPETPGLPLAEIPAFIRPERVRIERRLLELEKETEGRAFAYAGTCLYCPQGECSRCQGLPCRHPELVRPSLEAVGFDLGRTASEVFGLEMVWSKDGSLPPHLILISAVFHNNPALLANSPAL